MKRVVLISVLSFVDAQLSGVPSVKIRTAPVDDLYVVPIHGRYTNLEETYMLQNKKALYLSPLQSKPWRSSNTNILNPTASILVEENSLRIVTLHPFPNRKRSYKYKPVVFKPNSFQVKVPP